MKLKRTSTLIAAAFAALAVGCTNTAHSTTLHRSLLSTIGLTGSHAVSHRQTSASGVWDYSWQLYSISCARHDDCEAVGDAIRTDPYADDDTVSPGSIAYAFAEHWDGVRWTLQRIFKPGALTVLESVSCYAPDRCLAVGAYSRSVVTADSTARPLAEIWDGIRWRRVAVRAPKPVTFGGQTLKGGELLTSVSCTRFGNCEAIGRVFVDNGLITYGFSDRFNGTRFTTSTVPRDDLDADISCPVVNGCFAISTDDDAVQIDHQVNGLWTSQKLSLPKRDPHLLLQSLSCAAADDCIVTAAVDTFPKEYPAIEHFDGSSWRRMLLPKAAYAPNDFVGSAVSCSSLGHCVVIDDGYGTGSQTLVLAHGSWRVVATAHVKQRAVAISCPDFNYCVDLTAREYDGRGPQATRQKLAAIFDGRSWRRVGIPLPRI